MSTPPDYTGRLIKFDAPKDSPLAGKRLSGIIESSKPIGLTERGAIPDHELVVVGASGKKFTISRVNSYSNIT